jgi:hypothetical protein
MAEKRNEEVDEFNPPDAARRRDEVIHRMAHTPPQSKANPHPKMKNDAAAGRLLHRSNVFTTRNSISSH